MHPTHRGWREELRTAAIMIHDAAVDGAYAARRTGAPPELLAEIEREADAAKAAGNALIGHLTTLDLDPAHPGDTPVRRCARAAPPCAYPIPDHGPAICGPCRRELAGDAEPAAKRAGGGA